jgi:hypothetical protein
VLKDSEPSPSFRYAPHIVPLPSCPKGEQRLPSGSISMLAIPVQMAGGSFPANPDHSLRVIRGMTVSMIP